MQTKHDAIARDLRTPKYKPRTVRPRKGKGSYQRTERNAMNRRPDNRDGGFSLSGRSRQPNRVCMMGAPGAIKMYGLSIIA